MGEDPTIGSDLGPTDQGRVHADFDSTPEFDLGADERKGTDRHVRCQNRTLFDASSGVNGRHSSQSLELMILITCSVTSRASRL